MSLYMAFRSTVLSFIWEYNVWKNQGWAFGHWTFGQPSSAPDKIASARLLVGQTPEKRSDKLGQSDSSAFFRTAEPIFGQLDNSARLGFRSDKPKILDLGSAVGRTEEEILSECPPLVFCADSYKTFSFLLTIIFFSQKTIFKIFKLL